MILWLVTNIHPELYHGKHIIGWIIGFSLRKLRYVYQRLATHGLPPKILHHLWSKLSLPKNPSPGRQKLFLPMLNYLQTLMLIVVPLGKTRMITSSPIRTSPRILPLCILQTKRIDVINISHDSDDKRTRIGCHTEAELKNLPADRVINIILENSKK
jgi:hypothetical protein